MALPTIPDAGANRANIANGENEKHSEAFKRLNGGGEGFNRRGVGQIAALCDGRHIEVMFDKPSHRFRFGFVKPQSRTKSAGDFSSSNRMIFRSPFGHIVQEHRDVQDAAVADHRHDFMGDGEFRGVPARLNLRQRAKRAQQMFINGVMVVHVELHHRDDTAKFGHEFPQQAGFIHPAQRNFRRMVRGQQFHKQAVCLGVCPQRRIDEPQ